MGKEANLIYLDTNILAYVSNTKSLQHKTALEIFRPGETEILCVSSPVLAEFYSYVTNPSILVTPLDSKSAIQRIKRICQMSHIRVLPTPEDLFERWLILLEQRPVINGGIFDLIHIAIMLAYGIKKIYTFNVNDFVWCSEIEVIEL